MTIDTASIRRLAEAATPGPWEAENNLIGKAELLDGVWLGVAQTYGNDGKPYAANAAFIAALNPQTVLALCDFMDEAVSLLEESVEHGWWVLGGTLEIRATNLLSRIPEATNGK